MLIFSVAQPQNATTKNNTDDNFFGAAFEQIQDQIRGALKALNITLPAKAAPKNARGPAPAVKA